MLKKQDVSQYMESYYSDHIVEGNGVIFTHIKFNETTYNSPTDLSSRISFHGLEEES